MATRGLTAGLPLSRETAAALQASSEKQNSFLLVREDTESSAVIASARALAETLPQVWQHLFDAARRAQSSDYLNRLACRRPPLAGSTRDVGPDACSSGAGNTAGGGPCPTSTSASMKISASPCPSYATTVKSSSSSSASTTGDPSLGLTRETVFASYLSPEALVQHHRLGKPEVRRLYQALQVYSLGFHQSMLEATAHATDKPLLLLSLWRAFAMLWDGALQVVFPAETVKTSRERQAALLLGERLRDQLLAAEARAASLAQENATLKAQMESVMVDMLSVQADAAVAQKGAAKLEAQLRAARVESTAVAEQAEDRRLKLLRMQDKLAAVAGPQEQLYNRVQQLEQLLSEKQGQLSLAAKQASGALAAKEEALQVGRAERLRREAAEQLVEQLQGSLHHATHQLQEAAAVAAALHEQHAAEAAAQRKRQDAEAAVRAQESARLAGEMASWQRRAADAEACADALQQQLQAAQQQAEVERARAEELFTSMWPLAAKVKALEAAAVAAQQEAGAALPAAPAPGGTPPQQAAALIIA